jgi:rare lipoprotein A (peptidoglycan hydrolase)
MIAQGAAAIRQRRAFHLSARAAISWAIAYGTAVQQQYFAERSKGNRVGVAILLLAAAAATLAMISYQNAHQDVAAIEPVRNETIAFRQQVEAFDDQEGAPEAAPSNYPRLVQTVRFVKPDPPQNIVMQGEQLSKGVPHAKNGRTSVPAGNPTYRAEGIASWYGSDFHGKRTANGERYDMNGISAAHRTMPLPSYARVSNLDNGRSMIVRVNNRGPFVHNRIIDLSTGAAKALDFYKKGTTHVRVEFVGRAPTEGSDDQMLLATLRTGTPAPAPSEVMVASAKALSAKDGNGKESRSPSEHQ